MLAVLALFSGFFSEMVSVSVATSVYLCWRVSTLDRRVSTATVR